MSIFSLSEIARARKSFLYHGALDLGKPKARRPLKDLSGADIIRGRVRTSRLFYGLEVTMPTAAESGKPATDHTGNAPIIVDIGTQRRKRIKQLRQGRGRLMDEVNALLHDLKNDGSLSSSVQPIVIVVRERPRMRSLLWPLNS
jgi:hypothetical protein